MPPFTLFSRGDARVNAILAGGYHSAAGWGAQCSTAIYGSRAQNDAGVMIGFGVELRCQPAYFSRTWLWGLDLGSQNTLSTHVHHSSFARRAFDDRYPAGVVGVSGPRDDWYRFTSNRFRLGLTSAHVFDGHWSGAAAGGTLFALQDQGLYLMLIPFYFEVSARYAWE